MREDRNKIFIPMSIDQNSTTRDGYFSSPLKVAVAIIGIMPGIPWTFYSLKLSNNSMMVMTIAILLYLFLYSYLIRFFVFEERRLKRMLKTLERNKISKADYFWGIDEIDSKGVIKYKYSLGLRRAVVVKVTRGSAVGVPVTFEEDFMESNLKFTRSLLSQGFGYMKYTKMERKQLPDGLVDYLNRMERMEAGAAKSVVKMNLSTISDFTKDYKSVIVDYYVVSNTNLRLLSSFRSVVLDALRSAYGNDIYFRGTRLLDDDEVIDFIEDVTNVRGLSKKGYYEIEDRSFEEYGEVFRVFDDAGNEIYLDMLEEYEKASVDVIDVHPGRGKSLFVEDEEESSKGKKSKKSRKLKKGESGSTERKKVREDAIDETVEVERVTGGLFVDDNEDDGGDLFVDGDGVFVVDAEADEDGLFVDDDEEVITIYEHGDGVFKDADGNLVDEDGNRI